MRKIRVSQGDGHAWKCDGFNDPGMFDEDLWAFQGPGVRADAQCGSKNLLQRAILYRHEKTLLGRENCNPGRKKTIYKNLMISH